MKYVIKRITSPIHSEKEEISLFFEDLIKSGLIETDKEAKDLLIYVETGGTEGIFLSEIYPSIDLFKTVTFIASPYSNSLAASLEIKTFLHEHQPNLKVRLIHGTSLEVIEKLKEEVRFSESKNVYSLKNKTFKLKKKLGVVGKPSDWLISSQNIDYNNVKKTFGVELVDITSDEFNHEIELANHLDVYQGNPELQKYLKESDLKKFAMSLKILGALLVLIKRYHLDGLTVRCFDLLGIFHGTSCFALSYLNSIGYIATCEGDIPSMLSMSLLDHLCGETSFQANPSKINYQNNSIILAHCAVPLKMCTDLKYPTHYESGIGIGIKGELKLENAFIFKLSPSLDQFLFLPGKISQNHYFLNLCRTQISFVPQKDLEVNAILTANVANHLIIMYQKDLAKLAPLF